MNFENQPTKKEERETDEDLRASIREVLQDVPPPIRAFLAEGKLEPALQTILQKNSLHADQGIVVEREVLLTLLGIHEPAALADSLAREAALNKEKAAAVLRDINELIFSPLHRAMREKSSEGSGEVFPPQNSSPVGMSAPPPTPAPAHTPAPTPDNPPAPAPSFSLSERETPLKQHSQPPEEQPVPLRPKENTPLVKEYAVDPYREPIDSNDTL